MHCVYKITFTERKEKNLMPYYYIGSKSNASFDGSALRDKNGKHYIGSSTVASYKDLISAPHITTILYESDSYTDVLNKEKDIQIDTDVVADPRFFNRAIATINNYTDPSYATYKHITTNKCVRLCRDHPDVLSGVYVGVTAGAQYSEEERVVRGRSGINNGFYGRRHSEETKRILSERKKERGDERSAESIKKWVEDVAKAPKSAEHRNKIGRKGMIMLKNISTGESIRIHKDDKNNYDSSIWMNPVKAKKFKESNI